MNCHHAILSALLLAACVPDASLTHCLNSELPTCLDCYDPDVGLVGDYGPSPRGARIELLLEAALELETRIREAELRMRFLCQKIGGALDVPNTQLVTPFDPCEESVDALLAFMNAELDPSVTIALSAIAPSCGLSLTDVDRCARDRCGETVVARCEGTEIGACPGRCTGRCDGTCGSEPCVGTCAGLCDGSCEGQCDGICEGSCSTPNDVFGFCVGACEGTCTFAVCDGDCQGGCEGPCRSHCEAECAGLCHGGCDANGSPRCQGRVAMDEATGCATACLLLTAGEMECEPGEVAVRAPELADPVAHGRMDGVVLALNDHWPQILQHRVRLAGLSGVPEVLALELERQENALPLASRARDCLALARAHVAEAQARMTRFEAAYTTFADLM